jgi:iron-sulfur cluster assembly protein
MLTVTDAAKKQSLRLMEDEQKEGYFIRVGVQGGGCSGLMYQTKAICPLKTTASKLL